MTVELSLVLERDRVTAGADVGFEIALVNCGAADVTVRDPSLDDEWPKLEVLGDDGYRVAYAGRTDRERRGHEFAAPPVPERITLRPGQEARSAERALRWLGPLPPGRYRARLHLEADGLALRSSEVHLQVDALALEFVQIVGPHAGPSPTAFAMVGQRRDDALSLVAWLHALDWEGHLTTSAALDLGEVGPDALASVSRAGLPYPGQWVLWRDDARLLGFFQLQGTRQVAVDSALGRDVTLVGPALTELEGNDGSRPPPAEILGVERERAAVWEVAADGAATRSSVAWDLPAGALVWGTATLPESNERQAWLLRSAGDKLMLTRLCWSPPGPAPRERPPELVGELPRADVLGGGASLGADGVSRGAVVLRRERTEQERALEPEPPARYELLRFQSSPGAAPLLRVTGLHSARDLKRALVGVGPEGELHALLETVDGGWVETAGAELTLAEGLDGEPLAVHHWAGSPFALLATDCGPRFRARARR